MSKSEKLEYGKAVNERYDLTETARNLAFRATYQGTEEAMIDPTIAEWRVYLVSTTLEDKFSERSREEIPIKYCDQSDYDSFVPNRIDQDAIIEKLKSRANSMMCLDLDAYGKPIEIFGSHDSDLSQYLDLVF